MKKLTAIILSLTMALSLAACSTEIITSAERKPETVTIQALNANKEMTDIEVPYDPQRIAILDMPALDIVDALLKQDYEFVTVSELARIRDTRLIPGACYRSFPPETE